MYDAQAVRELFEMWGRGEIEGDPGESTSRWAVPHINHMILERWLPHKGRALDAGCGCGVEAVRMARRGLTVTALDISESLLRHARRRAELAGMLGRIEFVQADITEPLPLPQASFDVCTALTGVVSHTGDRHREAFANLVACVRPGGLLILGVDSYYGKIREYFNAGRYDEAERLARTHYVHTVSTSFEDYCFTVDEFGSMLSSSGCRNLAMHTAPPVGPYGYVGASDEVMQRGLALDAACLDIPELLGAGEQLIGVFERGATNRATTL